ncbi:hypothetical protein HFU84_01055 [Acidithiobacillus sp. CV18-2]|uniref:Uncharacterized protein n=1 Tax=Igneacidithiobacillus copahuensis TaxID=2724909 RepID=A0AAE3CKH9_9PROT|nr:hypothetical protein [Igneacidithiobacillus copahuensis]MBU2753307.1 hypothetical protein [Acidithiobacillus sp. CV18-3]MBU2756337.1 hypothetical protein [Acidithiobacillus sp. BN09-2]MBU2776124.1 hypothetical protein [Acidithiobacillus sp. CV18-2]MBU2795737.1 hypothetical protein [Acidithiobacillus sp. VAN18-2]MBU2798731.1 hypothetical protein [Acidithiobacillus sp. VAN18-4]UTV81631.1 hypothetical protein MQE22_03135 [Acidithiobacillus sp. YTS05]
MGLSRLMPILRGLAQVVLVLLAVLLGLLVDVLLLIPGLLLAYLITGTPWQWDGWVPSPQQIPTPWLAMGLAVLATLVPAAVDYLLIRMLRLP